MSHHFFTEDNVAVELTFQKLFKKLWAFFVEAQTPRDHRSRLGRSLRGGGA